MKTKYLLLFTLLCSSAWPQVQVRGYYRKDGTYVQPYERSSPSSHEATPPAYVPPPVQNNPPVTEDIPRTKTGRIRRSSAQKHAFMRANICPSTGTFTIHCPGYVVDHVVPLACGGPDDPSNMEYQTVADGKAKDKIERKQCGKAD